MNIYQLKLKNTNLMLLPVISMYVCIYPIYRIFCRIIYKINFSHHNYYTNNCKAAIPVKTWFFCVRVTVHSRIFSKVLLLSLILSTMGNNLTHQTFYTKDPLSYHFCLQADIRNGSKNIFKELLQFFWK